MITVCILEAKLPYILLILKRAHVHMHIDVHRLLCLHVHFVFLKVLLRQSVVQAGCIDVLSATSCLYAKCVYRGKSSGVRSSVGRGSDVVNGPRRSGIGVRLCVSCSLQGSCLHADSLQSVCCSQ